MRVAYICADAGVPVFGHKGCSIHVQEIIRALRKQGCQVELFAMNMGGDPSPDLETLPRHHLPAIPKVGRGDQARSLREQAALAANQDLYRMLREVGPFDLVYERYSLWSFAGMEYARTHGTPGVLEVNAPLIEEQVNYRGMVNRSSAEHVAARVFNSATTLLAVSDEIKTYLERYLISQSQIYVAPNGVNPDRFPANLAPTCPSSPGTFTVGFVGSLKPWHGLSILVEAFAILHQHIGNTRLLIVGDGPERADLEADLSAWGLSPVVHFTGATPPEAVPGLLASMDVAVAPYPLQSGFYFSPLKVYEYMAAGLPVVTSRLGQLAALIQDGVNGLLCPPGDVAALASALERLWRESEWRKQLGQAARTTVLQHYTWDIIVQRLLTLSNGGNGDNESLSSLLPASLLANAPSDLLCVEANR